ncbi:transmembrane prolyl 4-hydroxylase-like [Tiliqua scincoides]|uniref:transmembrane prolyl 4-hydroxylase-like n=1 Tax=Tiliqua scincoides TaxID=71010 RepID=UPI003462DFF6
MRRGAEAKTASQHTCLTLARPRLDQPPSQPISSDPSLPPRDDATVVPGMRVSEVGHKQEVELVPNKIHFMKTLSLKPLAFEIPDFLSEDECKLLINLAKREGLKKSPIQFSKERADSLEELAVNQMEIFNILDFNHDGQLQIIEMMSHERLAKDQLLTPKDIMEMYSSLKADPDGNGVLSLEEFKGVNMQDFYRYIDRKKTNKRELVRNSQQAWLVQGKGAHPIMHSIQQRVIHLTRLSAEIIELSEPLQVVRYDPGGYYHAHWDSGKAVPDISRISLEQFVHISPYHFLSRYATVLIYLSNVTGGGETNFPIADNRTYDYQSLIQNNIDLRDTYRHCDKGNLRIKPVQGTAVFWYNHLSDDEGWIGDIDQYSLHGGCLVTEGTKWIANQWISVHPNKRSQLLLQKVMAQHANDGDQSEGIVDEYCPAVHEEL